MALVRKGLLIAGCLSAAFHANAQKKQYTMAEATNGIVANLAPKGITNAAWRPATHELNYLADGRTFGYNADRNRIDTGATTEEWNKKLYRGEPATKKFIEAKWLTKDQSYFQIDSTLTIVGNHQRSMIKLPSAAANITVASGRSGTPFVAATVGNKLMLFSEDGETLVSGSSNPNIISGQAVHRNEFGIDKGIFFSPKGNYLAYYRMDQSMVADYPVIDWSQVPAKNENVKYPMAGGISHQVTVRVYNPKTQKTIELQTGKGKDHYLTCVTWSPDEQYIYIAILNRAQNHLWLNQYDAQTGEKVKTLFEETDEKYVEPQHPLTFLPGSNDQFIWWSQRDGYMHLYLCNTNGKVIRQLTKGPWVVNDLLGFCAERNEIIFTGSKEDPREKHGYRVSWKTGDWAQIDKEPGTHNFTVSDDGKYVLDVLTARSVPKKTTVRATDGSTMKVLVDAPDPLADYDRPQIKEVKLKADDGTPLYGKLILPVKFDPKKKYPVIVYLYNGPHVQLIKNGFPESGNLWYEYLAQHGYVVWTMDGRGSSNRGMKFEQATFRRLGTIEMKDQMQGVSYLKSLPYVDDQRLGIHGWSFGGFMTTSFMLRNPGVFKVAVAGGPVMDWKMYEIMYGERYMDTPEENPEGYEDANLLTKAKNLKGKLLLIHGTQDATVVWQHSINFLKSSVDEGVQVDYFVYPGYEHNVRGKDRVHLMQKITAYFDQNL